MNSSEYTPSQFYNEYGDGVELIKSADRNEFYNKLLFSSVISLMEKYLYDVFIFEISHDRSALIKLSMQNRFKGATLKIPYLMHNSVENYIVESMKKLIWHRLNDVDVFYKNVLDIKGNITDCLLRKLDMRHDIVHRNGVDLDGNRLSISDTELDDCIQVVSDFIVDIDKKYQAKN